MNLIVLSAGSHATYDGSRALNNRLTLAADTCPSMTRIPRTVDGRVGVYEPYRPRKDYLCEASAFCSNLGKGRLMVGTRKSQ
jgi:hypothetical protein